MVLRENTERPEAVEAGTAKIVGTDEMKIMFETKKLLEDRKEFNNMSHAVNPYGDGKSAARIRQIIIKSFINY